MRPVSDGGDPDRHWESGSAGTSAVNVAQEPGELIFEGNPEVGANGHGTLCDWHRLPDDAGASRQL